MRRRQFLQRLAGLALGAAVLPGALAETGPKAVDMEAVWRSFPRGKVPYTDEPFWAWCESFVRDGFMSQEEYLAKRRKWGYES